MAQPFWINQSNDPTGTATGWYEYGPDGQLMAAKSPYASEPVGSLAFNGWKDMGGYFQLPDGRYAIPQTDSIGTPYDPATGAPTLQTWVSGDREKGQVANFGGQSSLFDVTGMPSHPTLGGTWNQALVSDTAPNVTGYESPKDGNFFADALKAFATGPGIPLGGFMAAGGLGAFTGGAAEAAGGAMDMGVGGVGEAMGLGGGAGAGGLGGLADMPWGVNSQGSGNMFDLLSETSGLDGGGFNLQDFYSGVDAADAAAGFGGYSPGMTTTAFPNGMVLPGDWSGLSSRIGEHAAKSILSRVMNGTATNDDYAMIAGKLGAAALGAIGSNQQANSLQALANKYSEYGAPSRARFEASMTPGFDPTSIPGYAGALDTASKGILARLSATGGNPFGNPGGLIEANKAIVSGTALPAINEYQRLNANTGFGSSMNAAIPLETGAVAQEGNLMNAVGYGLNQLTNKEPTLADMIKALQMGGLA